MSHLSMPISWSSVFVSLSLFLCLSYLPSPHLCTESLYGDTTDKPVLDCCACGTAKYRVTFYGNWSEKIHPKDYPRKHELLCSLSCHLCSITHLILIVALPPQLLLYNVFPISGWFSLGLCLLVVMWVVS